MLLLTLTGMGHPGPANTRPGVPQGAYASLPTAFRASGPPRGRNVRLCSLLWEVIETLQNTGEKGERAIDATAEWGSLSPAQVRIAVRYFADHRDELDERIRLNREEADREFAAWQRAQDALA
jgi:hypothetical protein